MANLQCPRCGARSSGNFCSSCGASLKPLSCPACGATPEAGARFCNLCGQALSAPSAAVAGAGARSGPGQGARATAASPTGDSKLGWWVAGFALVALIVIVALPIVRPDTTETPPLGSAPGGAPGGAAAVDLSTMTPREAADRLYERVMRAEAAGDSDQVQMFLPMATQAYAQARPLDADGLFHLAVLLSTGGSHAEALAVAQEALETQPDHLLNLGAAAQAAEGQGDLGTARGYYQRFLDVYDQERAKGLSEYEDHVVWFEGARERALAATSG